MAPKCDSDNATKTPKRRVITPRKQDENSAPFQGAIWDDAAGWLSRVVKCESVVKYKENPFQLPVTAKPLSADDLGFIMSRLYPMPSFVKNCLIWIQRCDLIYTDFKKERGALEREGDFWAAVLAWLPELKAFPQRTTETRFEESIAEDGTRRKAKFYWELETYYIRGLGYNGSPPNPWGNI